MMFQVSIVTAAVFAILITPNIQMSKIESEGNNSPILVDTNQFQKSTPQSSKFDVLRRRLPNTNDGFMVSTQSRTKRAGHALAIFKFNENVRWLAGYGSTALLDLLKGATKVSAKKTRVIYAKTGTFHKAMQDFGAFNPYDVHHFQKGEGKYGVSAKINGYTDVQMDMGTVKPELTLVVRNWSSSPPYSST